MGSERVERANDGGVGGTVSHSSLPFTQRFVSYNLNPSSTAIRQLLTAPYLPLPSILRLTLRARGECSERRVKEWDEGDRRPER